MSILGNSLGPFVLNCPVTFVPELIRCSSAFCLYFFTFFEKQKQHITVFSTYTGSSKHIREHIESGTSYYILRCYKEVHDSNIYDSCATHSFDECKYYNCRYDIVANSYIIEVATSPITLKRLQS